MNQVRTQQQSIEVTVRLITGKQFKFSAHPKNTIHSLKKSLSSSLKTSPEQIIFMTNRARLRDEQTLDQVGLRPDSFIACHVQTNIETPKKITIDKTVKANHFKPVLELKYKDPPSDFEDRIDFLRCIGYPYEACAHALKLCNYDTAAASEVLFRGTLPNEAKKKKKDGDGNYVDDSEDEMDGEKHKMKTRTPEAIKKAIANFTPEDKRSIKNLMYLGFDESTVIQVYIACDQNQEKASECLFSMT